MSEKYLHSKKEQEQKRPRAAPPGHRLTTLRLRLLASPEAGKRTTYLPLHISIKAVTSRETAKKRSGIQKAMPGRKGKKYEEMAKHPKERRSGPPRGSRQRQRRRQRRVGLATAKQPLPPFFLFMAQHRAELQKSNPRWSAVETAKKLGKMWHKQPEEDKEMYKERAAQLRRKKPKRTA